jgi:hypothetical protein
MKGKFSTFALLSTVFVILLSVFVLAPGNETVQNSCTDTDGDDPTQKGKVYGYENGEYYKHWDFCNTTFLVEYYCVEDSYAHEILDCSADFEGCHDGACVSYDKECIDSDGGKNYHEKGTATAGSTSLSDHCSGNILTEKYCSDDEIKWLTYECPNGCLSGACLESEEDEEWEEEEKEEEYEKEEDEEWEEKWEGHEEEEPVTPQVCNGCLYPADKKLDACVSFGTRLELNGTPHYCNIDKTFKKQKGTGGGCQNHYECTSNFCSEGECFDVKGELEETKGILQSILNFFKSIFGFV